MTLKNISNAVNNNPSDIDFMMNMYMDHKRKQEAECKEEKVVISQKTNSSKTKKKMAILSKLQYGLVIGVIIALFIAVDIAIICNNNIVYTTISNTAEEEDTTSYQTTSININTEVEVINTVEPEEPKPTYELIEYDLPSKYYTDLDFSSFQPYMDYRMITNTSSSSYKTCYSPNAYTDENGFRRIITDGYKVDNQDDYVIALGTYYNEHMTTGSRWLVITTNGSYTATVGDEKQDIHTDAYNMFGIHGDGTVAGMIEWIVDTRYIDKSIKIAGSATAGNNPVIKGEIIAIYKINNFNDQQL